MEYRPTASSAIEFSNANKLEEWIHLFLCGEGDNKPFSDGLKLEPRRYTAPAMISLDTFKRDCGWEEGMRWQIGKEAFDDRVNGIIRRYENGEKDMPPLIVYHDGDTYELNDGNHRHEALKKLNIEKYWVIFWKTIQERA